MKFFQVKNYLIIGILMAIVSVNAIANISGPGPIEGSESVLQGKLTFGEQATVSGTITPSENLIAGRIPHNFLLAEIIAKASTSNSYVAIKWSTPGDSSDGSSVRNIYDIDDAEKKYPLKVKLQTLNSKQDGEWSVSSIANELDAKIKAFMPQIVKPGTYNFEITSAIWYDENQV